jgi:hypothetical protein
MAMTRIARSAVSGTAVVLAIGCSSSGGSGGGDACASDSDCKGSRVCVAGECVDPSPADSGTKPDTAPVCRAAGESCAGTGDCCQTDKTAPKGEVCITSDHVCHAKCGADSECESGCCAKVTGETFGACAAPSACCECTAGSYACSGTGSIQSCDDGCHWTTDSCGTLCKSAGYDGTTGCEFDADRGHDTCSCFYGGIGDACTTSSTCAVGGCESLAHWCGPATDCVSNTNCIGTGPGGRNHTSGYSNYCVGVTGGGHECFPGCSTDADCAGYSFGVCKAVTTISGSTQYVCTSA